ncbi:MAG: hypothetical protein ABJF01_11395 [bacterium]
MSHLPTERLAAFVNEPPSATEMAHLAACAECARERATYRQLAELSAGESSRIGKPLTSWEKLRPALIADGVIDDGHGVSYGPRHVRRPWLQVAAAVLLVAGGMMAGRRSAGASLFPAGDAGSVANSVPVIDSAPKFGSLAEARAAQTQSQLVYQSATAFLAERDTSNRGSDSPASMRTRLAALDRTRQVLGAALNDAPYDPVINGYYLTTLGQREATLRQLNTFAPASMRIQSY